MKNCQNTACWIERKMRYRTDMRFEALNFNKKRSTSRRAVKTNRNLGREETAETPTVILFRCEDSQLGLEIALRLACKANSWILVITMSFLVFLHFTPFLQHCGGFDNQQHHIYGSCKTNKHTAHGEETMVLNIPEAPSLQRYHDLTPGSLRTNK